MRQVFRGIAVFLLFFGFAMSVQAQDNPDRRPQKTKKSRKEFAKKGEEREAEALTAQEEGRKRHVKLQDKETRKRMKRSRKKAERYNKHKREPFLRRLFRKRH